MGTTGNRFIDFVSELIYGDMGTAELGLAPPPGGKNHIHWTRQQAQFREHDGDGRRVPCALPYGYRYWAFMRWASDLRRLVLGQPLFHVHKVDDADGTVLSEKGFTDIYHQVHHV